MERTRRVSPQTAAVLTALADRGGQWSHGYDLCVDLGIKAGTMYPILMRLAERDQLEAAWEEDPPRGRPPRHLYRLSPVGAELVARLRAGSTATDAADSRAASPTRPAHPSRPAMGAAGT